MQESQETINQEEVETREHHARVGHAHMKDEEDHEEDVKVMSVEEELKDFTPNARDGSRPHDQSKEQR